MKKEEIHLNDWQRILFGNAPIEFMLEVFIRSVIMYLLLLVVMRLLGKRMSGQMTILELSVMVTLGAIVSLPMQSPDRGILQGVIILALAFLYEKGITLWGVKSKKGEAIIQGTISLLVKDGVMQTEEMSKARISRQQLYASLRGKNIHQLGKVKRVYFEACGTLSIYEEEKSRPGLSILPKTDKPAHAILKPVHDQDVCINCGTVQSHHSIQPAKRACPRCGNKEWIQAVV